MKVREFVLESSISKGWELSSVTCIAPFRAGRADQ